MRSSRLLSQQRIQGWNRCMFTYVYVYGPSQQWQTPLQAVEDVYIVGFGAQPTTTTSSYKAVCCCWAGPWTHLITRGDHSPLVAKPTLIHTCTNLALVQLTHVNPVQVFCNHTFLTFTKKFRFKEIPAHIKSGAVITLSTI